MSTVGYSAKAVDMEEAPYTEVTAWEAVVFHNIPFALKSLSSSAHYSKIKYN